MFTTNLGWRAGLGRDEQLEEEEVLEGCLNSRMVKRLEVRTFSLDSKDWYQSLVTSQLPGAIGASAWCTTGLTIGVTTVGPATWWLVTCAFVMALLMYWKEEREADYFRLLHEASHCEVHRESSSS